MSLTKNLYRVAREPTFPNGPEAPRSKFGGEVDLKDILGGGFKDFLFSPLPGGRWTHFD